MFRKILHKVDRWLEQVVLNANQGRDRSVDFNRTNGFCRVRYYPDSRFPNQTEADRTSIPMCYDVACDYANIFGGEVLLIRDKRVVYSAPRKATQ